jgi:hypothetical protein
MENEKLQERLEKYLTFSFNTYFVKSVLEHNITVKKNKNLKKYIPTGYRFTRVLNWPTHVKKSPIYTRTS